VHLLNNTALATPRALVAILETFQTKRGTVKIPKVLWPYMSGMKEIGKKKGQKGKMVAAKRGAKPRRKKQGLHS